MMHPDLKRQAKILAEWAEKLPLKKVYIFGSRVRGDATAASDLDVAIELEPPLTVNEAMWNWKHQEETEFAELKKALDIPLSLHRDEDDHAWPAIRAAATTPVLSVGKVVCVLTPRVSGKNSGSMSKGPRAAECIRS
jgi:Nucleotidyltransferase domain